MLEELFCSWGIALQEVSNETKTTEIYGARRL
jgi:hypothetical protein